jgi:two-component system chemotaxis sensor kinase CheA
MYDESTLLATLQATFEVELRERVGALELALVQLEDADEGAVAAAALDRLYRVAYNLQGAARVLGLGDLAHLAGALAAAFERARGTDAALLDRWFAAIRRAIVALPRFAAGAEASSDDLFALLADLVAPPATPAADAAGQSPPVPAVVPDPPERPALPAVGPMSDGGGSVRIQVNKLDALFAGSGELTVARIRIEQRLGELGALRDDLALRRRGGRLAARQRDAFRRQLAELPGSAALLRDYDRIVQRAMEAEGRVAALGQALSGVTARLRQDVLQLGGVAQGLSDEIMAARLLPVATAFGPFERLVRDLAREQQKPIELALRGGETEIDRKILERLRDPLMHMLRNAVDHGIESSASRAASGKKPGGRIALTVANRGGAIVITLDDDGAGLDPARLRAAAVRKGLLTEERATLLDETDARALIFHPGFSTTAVATATSGRGVGMDVVRDEVNGLGGQIAIASVVGMGTTFTITVPLTLATTRAILVEVGGQLVAIPANPIERLARIRTDAIVTLEGRRAVPVEGQPVPLVALGALLALPDAASVDAGAWQPYLVLRQEGRRIAILVDRLRGEQEIVVKPLGWPLRRVRNVGGVAVLGSGETVAILNPADLLVGGLRLGGAQGVASARGVQATPVARRRRVLVVDDSLTTRTLERGILEAAGYETLVATDGAAALELLGREGVDLVVSDVEMPRLDGFGLATAIRRDEGLRHIPVILVTSLDTPEHRERGVSAGADAYLTKGSFDQGQLLNTIGRLL